MAEAVRYESHFSAQAAASIAGLPRRQQRKVLDLADQLARHPFQVSDYQTRDSSGRSVENLLIDAFIFIYWIDHAAREIRITEIIKV